MSKLSLQKSHITFLPIQQILHEKYVVHQTQAVGTPFTSHSSCHSYLTSPSPQHHYIVQAIPISPSPPSPTSALTCVAFDWLIGLIQQSWVLWLNLWQILQKYSLSSSASSLLILWCDPWHSWCNCSFLGVFFFHHRPRRTAVIFWVWHHLYCFHHNLCPAVEVFRILACGQWSTSMA